MTGFDTAHRSALVFIGGTLAVLSILAGCSRSDPNRVQGYVEGEFMYVASPFAGALETLHVQRGAQVKEGDPLFALDNGW